MEDFSNTTKSPTCHNKHQYKLISLTSTLNYLNKKDKKYNQKNILYYYNENLKRNGLAPTTLRTMQNYLYKLEKVLKVTTNYYQHMGVNCGTEIYYKLKYPKKECYQKINKYFKERKNSRFKSRVNKHFKDNVSKNSSVNSVECLSNKNNIKEEIKIKEIEKYQLRNYFNNCNFKTEEALSILYLNIDKDTKIEAINILKQNEIALIKKFNIKKSCMKEKQKKLKEILYNTREKLEENGYNPKQLEINLQKVYENYKYKPHFIIENHKYSDLNNIKRKLEKSIERKKENSQQNYQNLKENIFNILIEQLKKETNIEILKPIIKKYLNKQKKIEYNKVFGIYHLELLEIIKNEKNSLTTEEFSIKAVWGFNMENAPEPIETVKKGKCKVECQNKERFILIEKENGKAMYHTKIMMDIYKFGVYEKKHEFRLSLRALFNGERIVEETHLYPIKEGDKFIGIFYGYRKPIKKPLIKYQINGTRKAYALARAYYMEFRFKAGSVFCYFKGLYRLLDKKRTNNHYNKVLFSMFTDLEQQVYKFYGKKYPEQGPLIKWIIKNLK